MSKFLIVSSLDMICMKVVVKIKIFLMRLARIYSYSDHPVACLNISDTHQSLGPGDLHISGCYTMQ